jgi:hypothetical protein
MRCSNGATITYALTCAMHTSTIFFKIIFIFIKLLNCFSFNMIITKNQDENIKNSLDSNLENFIFKGNLVI